MTTILVLAEKKDGKVKIGTLEAIAAARQASQKLSADVQVAILGPMDDNEAAKLGAHGVTKVHHANHELLTQYSSDAYLAAFLPIVEKLKPAMIYAVSSEYSRDLLPRVVARAGGSLATDVIRVEPQSESVARVVRPVYAGKANLECACSGSPIILLTKPKAFTPSEVAPGKTAEVEKITPTIDPASVRSKVKEIKKGEEKKQVDLTEADIIVSGGRGLGDPKNFYLVEDLAAVLGARVGASRAVVDAGWRPHTDQVGQTGKIVSPKLYIAVGISGAIQHKVGAQGAKCIVAINKNPDAPIFKFADYGIVGDVFQIVPLLKEELKKLLGKT